MGVSVENAELVSVVDFRREMTQVLDRLQGGKIEKVVITKHGKMQCVVLTVNDYERLQNA